MKYRSVFDIIGPVMIGPSSSHTAGAARIGRVARSLFGREPKWANISFYGSFAETYRGHGTDVAIIGGLLDFDTFDEKDSAVIAHIDLADWADLVIVAPATANIIGKLANGIADNMITTTLLATTAPVWIAPAMNVHMYDHPAVKRNIEILARDGYQFIVP
ncbi:hypothetical protein NXY55_21770, partial [Aeromonas veronii]|nr:hypothetical protein [Aeromonas veronii]